MVKKHHSNLRIDSHSNLARQTHSFALSTHIHTLTKIHTHSNTHLNIPTHTHKHIHTHKRTLYFNNSHLHTLTPSLHIPIHTHTHIHTHKHTLYFNNSHSYTLTPSPPPIRGTVCVCVYVCMYMHLCVYVYMYVHPTQEIETFDRQYTYFQLSLWYVPLHKSYNLPAGSVVCWTFHTDGKRITIPKSVF